MEENNINTNPMKPNKGSNDLVNNRIPFKEVLVIDQNGDQLGTMSKSEAISIAEQQNLDLFCVSPNSKPPVCKILNYSKHKFDQQKKERERLKNQKGNVLKEIRFTPMTSLHDLETKANQAKKMLEKGAKLKVSVFIKGRMNTKMDLAETTLEKFIDLIKDFGFVEKKPQQEGKYYFCFISAFSKK